MNYIKTVKLKTYVENDRYHKLYFKEGKQAFSKWQRISKSSFLKRNIRMQERKLTSKDELTTLINDKGIKTWEETIEFVRCLPYGRNSNRTDLKLVITEQKGSCSSKHSFLKKVADLNGIPNIKLILGIYKMHKNNTPNIGNVLINNAINFIPEAHCYLKIDNERIDVTTYQSEFKILEKDIVKEIEIQPEQVSKFKVEYHKDYLNNWILENKLERDFDEVWLIREQCIENLTK